jgi:hypothetical protein
VVFAKRWVFSIAMMACVGGCGGSGDDRQPNVAHYDFGARNVDSPKGSEDSGPPQGAGSSNDSIIDSDSTYRTERLISNDSVSTDAGSPEAGSPEAGSSDAAATTECPADVPVNGTSCACSVESCGYGSMCGLVLASCSDGVWVVTGTSCGAGG